MTNYEKGKRWGFAVFRKNFNDEGQLAIGKADKAASTCARYASIGKRKGKILSQDDIDFYKGATVGFQEFYNKHINK